MTILSLTFLLTIIAPSWAQETDPTPSGEVKSATGGVVGEATASPVVVDSILFHIEQNDVIDEFRADQGELHSTIRSEELANAWVISGSNLFKWANYPDYMGMLDTIQELYSQLSGQEIDEAYEIRRGLLIGDLPDCFACMDAGLMAMAVGRYGDAEECFRLAGDASFYQGNPFPRMMAARSLLKQGRLGAATAEYEAAFAMVENASQDSNVLFRLHKAQATDLLLNGYVNECLQRIEQMLGSENDLERLWAMTRMLSYHWCKENVELVELVANELEALVAVVEPNPEVLWEHSRVRHAEKTLERIRGAQTGDPLKTMILDQESLEWEWEAGNFQAIVDRLEGWVDQYPIAEYESWDLELKDWGSWVHWTYHISLANVGDPVAAEGGLRAILAKVPFEEKPRRLVDSWCWLGHCLGLQKRYAEGVDAYETGLALDVAHLDLESLGVPIDFDQPRVRDGQTDSEWRAGYVDMYKRLLKWQALGPEYERLQREGEE